MNGNRKQRHFTLDFYFIQVSYLGEGQFYYAIRKPGGTKAGMAYLTRSRKMFLANSFIILMGLSVISFIYSSQQKNFNNEKKMTESGIGGLTTPSKTSLRPPPSVKKNVPTDAEEKQLEKDEAVKDLLMGAQEKSSAKKSKTGKKTDLLKYSYTVQPGDTLSEIAGKYNVSVESIAGSSSIKIPDDLRIGQKLQIPSKDGFFYSMKKDDRLAIVLKKHNVSLEKYLEENKGISIDLLNIGDEIFLPGAKPLDLISGWLVPVPSRVITSSFGWRRYPKRGFHKGLDLKASYAPVRATRAGNVSFAGWLGGYGKAIIVIHDNGYRTLYGHLSRLYVSPGMRVSRGRILGVSGNTGFSFGAHLHFEVTRNGRHIDPRVVLKGLRWKRYR